MSTPPWNSQIAVLGNSQIGKLSCQLMTADICESEDMNGSPLVGIWFSSVTPLTGLRYV